jgi:hypothetical protein
MKISELVLVLQSIKCLHGDLPVRRPGAICGRGPPVEPHHIIAIDVHGRVVDLHANTVCGVIIE